MWHGDEGLKRALYWGKRTIKWYVVDEDETVNFDYKTIASPTWATAMLQKNVDSRNITAPRPIDYIEIVTQSDPVVLSELQKNLIAVNILPDRVDIPNLELATEHALKQFQLKYGVISDPQEVGAWVYGPKTRAKMTEVLAMMADLDEIKKLMDADLYSYEERSSEYAGNQIKAMAYARYRWVGANVRALQFALADLGYFDHAITGRFWDVTFDALAQFQIDNDLIESQYHIAAGILGPKTQAALKSQLQLTQKDILLNHNDFHTKKDLLALAREDLSFERYENLKTILK